MINSLLYRLTDRLPARIISDDGTPYLERYYVGTVLGVRFYLHRFVGSDPDRGRHDHPWPWAVSLILSRWYWEETSAGTFRRRWLNFLVGDSFHRVVLPMGPDGAALPVWTLFAHRAKRTKRWGFMRQSPLIQGEVFIYKLHQPSVDEDWWMTAPNGYQLRGYA